MSSLTGLFEKFPYWLTALVARLALGLTFWNSGRTKVDGWNIFAVNDKTKFLFGEEYMLPFLSPEMAALLAQIAEHTLPVLLIIGLGTRYAALGLLAMTVVIQIFVYPQSYVVHGTWAAILLMLVSQGAGKISVDSQLGHRFG